MKKALRKSVRVLVETIYHTSVLPIDYAPLYFQRGRQLAAFHGELVLQHGDLLNLFKLREVLRTRRNLSFEQIDDTLTVSEVSARAQVEALMLRIGIQLIPSRHD